jgi:hypothetical protein
MKIQIPDTIDLSLSEQYILTIEVYPEQFSFSLFHPAGDSAGFTYRIPGNTPADTFARFRDIFFDNEFFAFSFRKTVIINHTPVFTYVPSLIFDEKDKKEYMNFLFLDDAGKILCQTIQKPDITILHRLPDEIYEFFQRSFPDAPIIHHTAPLIRYFQEKEPPINGNQMIVNKKDKGMDILCFSRNEFLLGNHFNCPQPDDALYYILFVWKHLKFNQLKDSVYITGNEPDLTEQLKIYVQNIAYNDVNIIHW